MKLIHAIVPASAACALALLGTSAMAQDAAGGAAAPAQPATPPAAQAPASPSAGAASFTDAEVGQFAKAVTAVQAISQDAATPAAEKQTKMAAAVQQAGLAPERFNQIASASQSDPALMQRIQAAAAKPQG